MCGTANFLRFAGAKAIGLQAAIDQFLPEPLRELFAVAKLPPIAALSAHGFLAVNLHVTTGRVPQVLSKRQQLGVLACSVNLHSVKAPVMLQPVEADRFCSTNATYAVGEAQQRPLTPAV